MKPTSNPYSGHRYPTMIISHAVWLYFRFTLSYRDVEEILAARGIVVSYEAIRQWCQKFGQQCANNIRHRRGSLGDTWFMDEVFITTNAIVFGELSIRMVMCWISLYKSIAIDGRPSGSFASY